MPLRDINILPSTYPHFDWADWPKSKSALVQGGLTAEFEKEAWNAIVDHVAAVLANSGLAWDGTYTTADGAKITEAYGALSAAMFNSVRHNIDHPAPLPWAWAKDKNFRGYVGYMNFRGAAAYGKNGDLVYPEYIEELTRRLNLLIAIATGEVALPFSYDYLAKTIIDVTAKAQHSRAVHSEGSASTIYVPQGIDVVFGKSTGLVECAESLYKISSLIRDAGAANLRRSTLKTDYSISARRRITLPASPTGSLGKSLHDFQIVSGNRKYTSTSEKALSTFLTEIIAAMPHFWEVTKEISTSIPLATAAKLASLPIIGAGKASSNDKGVIEWIDSFNVRSRNPSKSLARGSLELFDFGNSEYAGRSIYDVTSHISRGELRRAASLIMAAFATIGAAISENTRYSVSPAGAVKAETQERIVLTGRASSSQTRASTAGKTVGLTGDLIATAGAAKAGTLAEDATFEADAKANASAAEGTIAHDVVSIGGDAAARASDSHRVIHEAQAVHAADATAHSSDTAPTVLAQQSVVEIDTKAVASPSHVTQGNAKVVSGGNIDGNASDARPEKLRARATSESESDAASSPSVRSKIELLALSGNSVTANASDTQPTAMDAKAQSESNSEAAAPSTVQQKTKTEIISAVDGSVAAVSPPVGARANCEAAAFGNFVLSSDDAGTVEAHNAEVRASGNITLKVYRPVSGTARHDATVKLKAIQSAAHTHGGVKADKRIKANHTAALNASAMPTATLRKVVQFGSDSDLNKGPVRGIGAAVRAEQTVNARFSATAPRRIERLKADCRSGLSAKLSFDKVAVEWIYPVQVGNMLLIRQAYDTSLNDNVLSIDAVVAEWSYPVKTGNTLLITQVYAAEINDTQLVLD